jgi:hypothetical protein
VIANTYTVLYTGKNPPPSWQARKNIQICHLGVEICKEGGEKGGKCARNRKKIKRKKVN